MATKLPDWLTPEAIDKFDKRTKALSKLAYAFSAAGPSFIRGNGKVGASLDVDAICTAKCKYCYVSNRPEFLKPARDTEGIFYDVDTWCPSHEEAYRAFLKAMKNDHPEHFLRVFAHSDFKSEHKKFWVQICKIAAEENVPTVVFTKMRPAVTALAPHVTRLMISRDNSKRWDFDSPTWVQSDKIIDQYMQKYDNVFRVAMVVDERDIEEVKADWYIAFHGQRKHLPHVPKPISQTDLLDIVGRKRGCTPAHRCIGCPTKCATHMQPESRFTTLTVGTTAAA